MQYIPNKGLLLVIPGHSFLISTDEMNLAALANHISELREFYL